LCMHGGTPPLHKCVNYNHCIQAYAYARTFCDNFCLHTIHVCTHAQTHNVHTTKHITATRAHRMGTKEAENSHNLKTLPLSMSSERSLRKKEKKNMVPWRDALLLMGSMCICSMSAWGKTESRIGIYACYNLSIMCVEACFCVCECKKKLWCFWMARTHVYVHGEKSHGHV
jgi:hypothetical protein